jgi:hypothetical protein
MFALVIVLILGLIVVAGIAYAVFGPKPVPATDRYGHDGRPATRWVGAVVAGVAFILGAAVLFGSMYTPVGTSDVAVVTSFGHTDGDLQSGVHLTAPWQDTTTWDHSVQRTSFEGKNCLQVRIFGGQTACLPTVIQWQAVPAAADSQFKRFRTFLRMQAAYMSASTIVGFFNNSFETFNPITTASLQANGGKGGTTVTALVKQVAGSMRTSYAGQVNIERITVGTPQYSQYVDGQLGKVVGAKVGLETATINAQTAVQEANAAKNLQSGGHLSPLVVLQNCVDTVKALAQAGESTAPTFNCSNLFGGSGISASVLLGGK